MRIVENCKIKSRDVESDRDGSGSRLSLYGSQKRFLDELSEGMEQGIRVFLCLKSRQLGITTICLILDVAWLAMFPGINGALVVHNGAAKEKMRQDLQDIVASFPPNFFGRAFAIRKGRNNREFIEFTNGSRLNFIVAGEKDAERETFGDGAGYSLCHFTEIALYASEKALASFEQSLSTAHPNRLVMYESRASGFNHWRAMWLNAGRDYLTIRRIFIGWWSREDQIIPRTDRRFPSYGMSHPNGEESELMSHVWHLYKHKITPEQLAWYRHKISDEKMTVEIMHAQQPWTESQAFVAGGYSFFAAKDITKTLVEVIHDPAEYGYRGFRYIMGNDFLSTVIEQVGAQTPLEQRELRVWRPPVKGGQYAMGFDPAFGRNDNKDSHAISVWRCYADLMEQVAEYATPNVITEHAAWVMAHLAGCYEDCIINLELSGGPGHLVMQALQHVRDLLRAEMYQDMVKERRLEDFLTAARWYMYRRPDAMGAGYVWNTLTSSNSKLPLMESFRTSQRSGALIIRSEPLLREMIGVRQEGIKIEAPGNSKDDRVVAAALANQAWVQWRRPQLMAIGATFESEQRIQEGGQRTIGDIMNGMVRNFLRMNEEADAEPPRGPEWMVSRGLV